MTDNLAFEGLVPNEYFTYEGRLGSFHQVYPAPKRRQSGATKGGKNLTWPHMKYLVPGELAKAGFVWRPFPDNPDNVACFLCNKSLDGWEEGDRPLEEHLKHSPNCGWAIVAGIEANINDLATEDPASTRMIEARKATFDGRWPHEGKRGWKNKIKQLAEAGWKYTPSIEYNDMTTCTYCELALDGWEQNDKPMDEHFNRSPSCPYFALVDQYAATRKPKGKAARGSKTASRLSVQSVATAASDITSMTDVPAEYDDSVLTTTSTMAGKKGARAKKASTATKGRKTKAKKDEPVEVVEDEAMPQEEVMPPPPKTARGRKRTSDEVDESALAVSEAPAPKKRTARGRCKATAENSMVEQSQQDISIADAPQPAKAPKGRKTANASGTKGTRKASGTSQRSTASVASSRAAPGAFPEDDDEITRQLEADLERPLTDDEDIMQDSDSERNKVPAPKSKAKKIRAGSGAAASPEPSETREMFDAEPYVADEDDVDEDMKQLEAEMTIDESEMVQVPKKGRKAAGTRKVSKQTKAQKAKAVKAPVEEDEPEVPAEPAQTEEAAAMEEDELSTATVITKPARTSMGKKRGRPSKASLASRASLENLGKAKEVEVEVEVVEPEAEIQAEPKAEEETASADTSVHQSFASARQTPAPADQRDELGDEPEEVQEELEEEREPEVEQEVESEPEPEPTPRSDPKESSPAPPSSPVIASSARHSLQHQHGTPRISPAQSARQAAVSPSPSPQSSDAENQPPSSRPSSTSQKRVTHAPVSSTPARPSSPCKRKALASLQSTTPWNPVDIDLIFGSPEKSDKRNPVDRLLHKGSELTSPEKRMTVEEWIHHNADQAEAKLRQECEAMVSKFESEGSKAMNVLEGLIVD
ncbi:AT hook domain-containing protein [Colletotrichum graminicola]|uniref:AT hook domain-containing protein n=1 Tax=Colletotrichum graminicola (strain M1.001 / M2 / FGSC 10212) TaxID=645133 RepID=E3QMP3_COLGM|nr:AT hook domain-containing protein [Colletotrichum graminicola M1.001]EFQ32131.1 AT hook domain-containing protein [Colletotrichum graminicola M1.001]WDK16972.1 AT hook domain-containing protein [Colletotrichum graminicola]